MAPLLALGVVVALALAASGKRTPRRPALTASAPRRSEESDAETRARTEDAADAYAALDDLAEEEEEEEEPLPTPEEAAEAVQDGDPTQEDYVVLAEEAEGRGMAQEANQLRARAESAPATAEVVEAEEAAEQAAIEQGMTPDDNEDPPANPQVAPQEDPANPAPEFTPPAGFAPSEARSLAGRVSDNIWDRKYSYNRNLLKQFQRAAGIAQDGLYGPASKAALVYYLGPDDTPAPKALFNPRGVEMEYPEALRYWARRNGYNSATSGRSSRRKRRRKKRRRRMRKAFGLLAGGPLAHKIMAAKKLKKKRAKKRRRAQRGRVSNARVRRR